MRRKKSILWISAAIMTAFGITAVGYAQENEKEERIEKIQRTEEETALEYVKLLGEKAYDDLMTKFSYTEEMEAMVKDGSLQKSYESLMGMLKGLKEVKTPFVMEQYGCKTVCVPCQFEVQNLNLQISFQDGKIAGVLTALYQEVDLEDEEKKEYAEKEISISIGEGMELPGTLTLPDGEGPFPLVVFVHGSGPSDRDETINGNKPFKDLAEGLAEKGIASYRYDKRTYVYQKEAAMDIGLTVKEETVDDAVSAVKMLKEIPDINPEEIFVAGHSLGGYAVPLIDGELEEGEAAGYILLAAPVQGLAELMKEQYDFLFEMEASPSDAVKEQKKIIDAELEKLDHLDQYEDNELIMGAYVPYWKNLEQYDIEEEAKKIEEPCLILQGEEDYQVTMREFESWKEIFSEKINAQFVSFPGLTHLFMEGKKENGSRDYQNIQHVSPEVISEIAEFVKEERKND
ncbi:MAG: alpha/beta hydrolase [Eubacteriales bacterium]|nr:alpha/beta hydrolase [Eubacteriales bacterium]